MDVVPPNSSQDRKVGPLSSLRKALLLWAVVVIVVVAAAIAVTHYCPSAWTYIAPRASEGIITRSVGGLHEGQHRPDSNSRSALPQAGRRPSHVALRKSLALCLLLALVILRRSRWPALRDRSLRLFRTTQIIAATYVLMEALQPITYYLVGQDIDFAEYMGVWAFLIAIGHVFELTGATGQLETSVNRLEGIDAVARQTVTEVAELNEETKRSTGQLAGVRVAVEGSMLEMGKLATETRDSLAQLTSAVGTTVHEIGALQERIQESKGQLEGLSGEMEHSRRETTKLQRTVHASVAQLKKLRNYLDREQYVRLCYDRYANAKKRIAGCLRLWTVDRSWVATNCAALGLSVEPRRQHRLPLDAYLSTRLAVVLDREEGPVPFVTFVGPVAVSRAPSLLAFPLVIWRVLVITALNRRWPPDKRIRLLSNNDLTRHFVVVDDLVLVETPEPDQPDVEFGRDLGKQPRWADQLCSEIAQEACDPVVSVIDSEFVEILQKGREDGTVPVQVTEADARSLFRRIFADEAGDFGSSLPYEVVRPLMPRIARSLNIDEAHVGDALRGLIWDYLRFASRRFSACPREV